MLGEIFEEYWRLMGLIPRSWQPADLNKVFTDVSANCNANKAREKEALLSQ